MFDKWAKNTLDAWALIVSVLALTASVSFGGWQILLTNKEHKLARELKAYDTWLAFFSNSMANPELASGFDQFPEDLLPRAENFVELPKSEVEKSYDPDIEIKYIWFVESMLIAAEQVVRSSPRDVQWQHSIMFEVRAHRGYIFSDEFLAENFFRPMERPGNSDTRLMSSYCTYQKELRSLIRKAFEEDTEYQKLLRAEDKCKSHLSMLGSPNL